jgi:putative acetyltransferase
MAVLTEHQRTGIGSQLVEKGLSILRERGCGFVVVLGHPEYYPRFGFVPASRFGLTCEYDVPDEVFMALELQKNALQKVSGVVKYHSEFIEIE